MNTCVYTDGIHTKKKLYDSFLYYDCVVSYNYKFLMIVCFFKIGLVCVCVKILSNLTLTKT